MASLTFGYPSGRERDCQSILCNQGNSQTKYKATDHATDHQSRLGTELVDNMRSRNWSEKAGAHGNTGWHLE